MWPTLKEGDIVIYRQLSNFKSLTKSGDIVVLNDPLEPNSLIVKRIYKETKLGLELRGDNEQNSIDSRSFGLVNYSQLIGIVEEVIPNSL